MLILDHISIICSDRNNVSFYLSLGFDIISEKIRTNDTLLYMSNGLVTLELYIDPKHPKRISMPEALGLRHLGFKVDNIVEFAKKWHVELKNDERGKFCFIYDPDGLPIEIRTFGPDFPKN